MVRKKEVVSKIMASIRSSDTSIEQTIRKGLWRSGLRYRKNYGKLYGKPDVVFLRKRIAIFCDSDFWHGREWEKLSKRLKTNPDYWLPKIKRNIDRDHEVNDKLRSMGWTVLRFWESDIKKDPDSCLRIIRSYLGEE